MTPLVLLGVAAAAIGALAGRWAVVPPLIAPWPLFILGVGLGWWGHGLGEFWALGLIVGTASSAIGAVVGVLGGRMLRRQTARDAAA